MRYAILVVFLLCALGCDLPKAEKHPDPYRGFTAQAINSMPAGSVILVQKDLDSDGNGFVVVKDHYDKLQTFRCTILDESATLCRSYPIGTDFHNLPVHVH